MAAGHSVDEYLETIYFLAFPIGEYRPLSGGSPTLASRVAEMLGVSRASAGEMLKRLERDGLIERGEHKEALLTAAGRKRAERVVRKHRIIERLLTDFMGYTAAEAHVHADELGDTFTDDMVERIDERLGHPERCPHGWPVDPDVEQDENQHLAPLSGLDAGTARQVKNVLRERVAAGGTVIMTTHILEVAERMADRIGVIAGGRLIAEGTLDELHWRVGKNSTSLEDTFLALVAEQQAAA